MGFNLDNLRDRAILTQIATGGGGSAYSTEYQAVYDSFTTPPGDAIASAQDTMVASLVTSGEWSDLDVWQNYANETNAASEALINWVAPGINDGTLANAPAFTSLEGFAGNGSNASILFFNPGDGGTYNYLQNSASLGVYIRNNVAEGKYVFASAGDCDQQLQPRSAGNDSFIKLNDNSNITISSMTDSSGLWIVTRTSPTVVRVYRNGVDIGGGTGSSAALINQMFHILCLNNNGTPALHCTNQVALAFAGGALTPTKVTNITNAFETYMDSNGKGVIP